MISGIKFSTLIQRYLSHLSIQVILVPTNYIRYGHRGTIEINIHLFSKGASQTSSTLVLEVGDWINISKHHFRR
jgi:hypothetical protein